MKQTRLIILILAMLMPMMASAVVKRTVHVATAGTLSNYISEDEKYQIEKLTLTGEINGDDIRFLREMSGGVTSGSEGWYTRGHTNGSLSVLDMSGVNIVAGGWYILEKYSDYKDYHTLNSNDVIPSVAFAYCNKLTSIAIPNSVTEIGSSAFEACTALTSITIPSSVTSIGRAPFNGCNDLVSIKVESGNTVYDSRNNCNAIIETETNTLISGCKKTIIPNSVTSIGYGALACIKDLTSMTIPNSVTSIEDLAFYYCKDLTSITIGSGVTSIGNEAFEGCSSLTSVTIPNSVTTIGSNAFRSCSTLTSVTIGSGVTSIGNHAFSDCSGVTSIKVESGNNVYDSRNNCDAIIETASNTLVVGCKNTAIPNSVTSIGDDAFWGCNSLTSVTIPNSVTTIGERSFSGCSGLTAVTIPNSVTTISSDAFASCSSLTSVTIPNSVTTIGRNAFWGCKGLTDVYCYAESVPVASNAFNYSNIDNATLYVPKGFVDAYKALVPWSTFKTIVEMGTVKLNKTKANLEKGKTMTLTPTVASPDKSVTWKSSNTAVATVTSKGKVKGVKAGTATITCTSVSTGAKATCKVTVGYVKLDQAEAILEKTKTMTLTAMVYPSKLTDKSVTWKSSNTKVATVSVDGMVTGVKAGTATITCISNATGLKTTCEVLVGYVKLDQTDAIIQKGKTKTLTATVYPSKLEDKNVTWTSSNTKIATVTSKGKVKGVKAGTATITCTSNATGLKTTCKVTVGYVKLDQTEVTVKKGKTVTLAATVYPSKLTDKSVTWESSNKKVATVTSKGKVKGVEAGVAVITCTSNAIGLSTICIVIVTTTSTSRSLDGDDDETTEFKDVVAPAVIEPFDVYDLSGRKVLHQVTSLDGLANGIYIVNGKKVLKKQ
jgi:uncharacterized protein YjdB